MPLKFNILLLVNSFINKIRNNIKKQFRIDYVITFLKLDIPTLNFLLINWLLKCFISDSSTNNNYSIRWGG